MQCHTFMPCECCYFFILHAGYSSGGEEIHGTWSRKPQLHCCGPDQGLKGNWDRRGVQMWWTVTICQWPFRSIKDILDLEWPWCTQTNWLWDVLILDHMTWIQELKNFFLKKKKESIDTDTSDLVRQLSWMRWLIDRVWNQRILMLMGGLSDEVPSRMIWWVCGLNQEPLWTLSCSRGRHCLWPVHLMWWHNIRYGDATVLL